MTVKEWLSRGRKINQEIEALIDEQERLMRVIGTLRPDKVQQSRGNVSEDKMVRYIEYKQRLDDAIDRCYDTKREIYDAISQVKDSTLRTLLILRYISFKSWEEIAEIMHYSRSQLNRFHAKAIKKIGESLLP